MAIVAEPVEPGPLNDPLGVDSVTTPEVVLKNVWVAPAYNTGFAMVTVYGAVPDRVVNKPEFGVASVPAEVCEPTGATVLYRAICYLTYLLSC
jgi:hypothetical protein